MGPVWGTGQKKMRTKNWLKKGVTSYNSVFLPIQFACLLRFERISPFAFCKLSHCASPKQNLSQKQNISKTKQRAVPLQIINIPICSCQYSEDAPTLVFGNLNKKTASVGNYNPWHLPIVISQFTLVRSNKRQRSIITGFQFNSIPIIYVYLYVPTVEVINLLF